MGSASLIFFAVIGLAISGFLLCSGLCRLFIATTFLPDAPGERSSHDKTRSRAGGMAILVSFLLAGIAAAWLTGLLAVNGLMALLVLSVLMGLVGVVDDAFGLSAPAKLIAQISAAVSLVFLAGPVVSLPLPLLGSVSLGLLGYAIAVIWIVAFVNIFNFMDGLNGIASGTALIGLIAMALFAALVGQAAVFAFCLILATIVTGFFAFNYPDGKIFLGDGGSLTLGFFLAGLAVVASDPVRGGAPIPVIIVPAIFLPFILDASWTLVRRAMAREKLFQAHRSHFYQRLNQAGWSHDRVTAGYMAAALLCAVVAGGVLLLPAGVQAIVVVLLGALMVLAARWAGQRAGVISIRRRGSGYTFD